MSRSAAHATWFVSCAAAFAASWSLTVAPAHAAPATDDQGFLDSAARCASPNVALAFGATATSRVAVCKAPDGDLEYRGVRISDGAKLIAPATSSGTHGFVAERDGI